MCSCTVDGPKKTSLFPNNVRRASSVSGGKEKGHRRMALCEGVIVLCVVAYPVLALRSHR